MTPLKKRTNAVLLIMASMYTQAGPGAVEVPKKAYIESFEVIKDLDEHSRILEASVESLSKKVGALSKKASNMSRKLKKIDTLKKRV